MQTPCSLLAARSLRILLSINMLMKTLNNRAAEAEVE